MGSKPGDVPQGWADASYLLLLRGILFFEADEGRDPHLYIAPGGTTAPAAAGQRFSVTYA